MSEQDTPTPGAREVARKITVATVTGGPKKWFEKMMAATSGEQNQGKTYPLMAVYGVATKATHGASDFGEWTKLHGNFRGVNLVDGAGDITNSSIVMLPPYLSGALEGALAQVDARGVQFAFELHAKYDGAAAQKFVYVTFDRMPVQEADPLEALEIAMGIRTAPALAAPNQTAALPPAPAAPAPAPVAETPKKRR